MINQAKKKNLCRRREPGAPGKAGRPRASLLTRIQTEAISPKAATANRYTTYRDGSDYTYSDTWFLR